MAKADSAATPKVSLAFSHLRKTRMCTFFKRDKCFLGVNCNFAHTEDELQQPVDLSKTSLCQAFLAGACPRRASECLFAHGRKELRRVLPSKACKSGPSGEDAQQAGSKACERRQKRGQQEASPEELAPIQQNQVHVDPVPAIPFKGGNSAQLAASELAQASPEELAPIQQIQNQVHVDPVPAVALKGRNTVQLAAFELAQASTCSSLVDYTFESDEDSFEGDSSVLRSSSSAATDPNLRDDIKIQTSLAPVTGTVQLPVFFWQNQMFVGSVEEVLRQAQPDHYED